MTSNIYKAKVNSRDVEQYSNWMNRIILRLSKMKPKEVNDQLTRHNENFVEEETKLAITNLALLHILQEVIDKLVNMQERF